MPFSPSTSFQVVDFYNFDDIASVETVKSSALQLVMHTGGRVVVTTSKAASIRDLISQFSVEAKSGQYEYARALADYSSREENALNFKAGDIVAVVPKEDAYTARGWLYGIKDGNYGVFPADYVDKMSPKSIRKEIKVISRITQASPRHRSSQNGLEDLAREGEGEEGREQMSPIDDADYSPGDTWNDRKARDSYDAGDTSDVSISAAKVSNDGKHPLLEFAMSYFRQSSFDQNNRDHEDKKKKKKKGSKNDWTWKDEVERVKWTDRVIDASLMRLEHHEMNQIAKDCFTSILRYMGDLPLLKGQRDVDCALTILSLCYKFDDIKDEVFCQVMKQTTNNKSPVLDSCQKGWRLFSIIAAYFTCSDQLKPFLFKYLETAAYDKRRAYHGTALVCLHNLRKTFKYGGRQMAPSIEEITAITAGRNSKRQIYRLPGGTERVINTKSTTVVEDIVEELCTVIGVTSPHEREEFSLYCIIEGQTFTRPLYKEQYILDVTTDLQKQGAVYYLIFCRSVWHYPLRLDNKLYIEVVFNQIAPDYLEGLLLVMPSEQIDNEVVYQVAKVAALLHKAADMDHVPTLKETKFLLPKPALSARDIKPPQWVNMVQGSWAEVQDMSASQAKAQVLQILAQWQLFGSSFFAVRRDSDPSEGSEHILALNKHGVHFLDLITHETILHYPFTEVISTRQVSHLTNPLKTSLKNQLESIVSDGD